MRRSADPMALDPLGPIATSPMADISLTAEALALEPLSPPSAGARPMVQASGAALVGRTGHPTGDPPGRDALRAPAPLPS
jgi:hypothetical protein